MTQILNIDALAKAPERTITLNGTTHPVKEMSVGLFIDATQKANEAETQEQTLDEKISSNIDIILQYVPTLSRDDLLGLSFEQLSILSAFIRGGVETDAEGNVVQPEAPADSTDASGASTEGDDAKK